MATGILQHRRDGTVARLLVTPADGEIFVDTDTYIVYIGDGSTAGGLPIGIAAALQTLTKTADYTISSGDNGTRFNNVGAGGLVNLTLPTAAVNLNFGFAVCAAQYLKIIAASGEKIASGLDNSTTAGYMRSNLPFSYFDIQCHATGQWIVSSAVGAWSLDA